jgi:uncharacterized protein
VEAGGAPYVLVHVLCICLLLGRIAHAYGVSEIAEDYGFRVLGMAVTLAALADSAASLLPLNARH